MLTLIVISVLVLSIHGQKNKNICPSVHTILCVKDVLLQIITATKGIKNIADKIEQQIFQRELLGYKLNQSVMSLVHRMHSDFPTFKYHQQFRELSNIDKDYFIHLIKEENYAFGYLYNSIENILEMENIFVFLKNESLKEILFILGKDILCDYRNILHVYSEAWISPDKINGLKILRRESPSFMHRVHSIVITRLLHQWIEHTDHAINMLENKLF